MRGFACFAFNRTWWLQSINMNASDKWPCRLNGISHWTYLVHLVEARLAMQHANCVQLTWAYDADIHHKSSSQWNAFKLTLIKWKVDVSSPLKRIPIKFDSSREYSYPGCFRCNRSCRLSKSSPLQDNGIAWAVMRIEEFHRNARSKFDEWNIHFRAQRNDLEMWTILKMAINSRAPQLAIISKRRTSWMRPFCLKLTGFFSSAECMLLCRIGYWIVQTKTPSFVILRIWPKAFPFNRFTSDIQRRCINGNFLSRLLSNGIWCSIASSFWRMCTCGLRNAEVYCRSLIGRRLPWHLHRGQLTLKIDPVESHWVQSNWVQLIEWSRKHKPAEKTPCQNPWPTWQKQYMRKWILDRLIQSPKHELSQPTQTANNRDIWKEQPTKDNTTEMSRINHCPFQCYS